MQRRTFDSIVTSIGLVLTGLLLVAGALMFWGYSFANDSVGDQLRAQRIFFPPAGPAIEDPAIKPYLTKYAGMQLVDGAQAEAYANHFIAVHLEDVADGKTYAEVSTLARANPEDVALQGQVQTLFRGETLRGLLLQAFAFWKIGQLAKIGSIVAFAVAGLMGMLTILGFWHLRRMTPTDTIFIPATEEQQKSA